MAWFKKGYKMKLSDRTRHNLYVFAVGFFMLIGCAVRLWRFGAVPCGINQDEAFAGYTAWALLKYGIDTSGYHFPVYLTAWGSGMNALESYLMLPFIALFGLKAWVIRLPQLIVGLLSLPTAYALSKRLFGKSCALMTLMLLALCPWHIMLCRWGLESNLAPGFLLFGLYFFIRGLDRGGFLPLSALMYGLSLYCYAAIWPVVPLMLLLMGVYCAYHKKLHFDRYLVASIIILALLAAPLLLFLLVNYDIIPEIKLPFFSVPRLLYMRSNELSLNSISENFKTLFDIIVKQTDGLPWNSTRFGLIYKFSLPFALIGLAVLIWRLISKHGFEPGAVILIQLAAALILGCLIDANVNRVNILFIPLIICTAVGLSFVCERLGKLLFPLAALSYLCAFMVFSLYYFKDYNDSIAYYFADGLEEAVETLSDYEGTVYVTDRVYYPSLLFYAEEDVNCFLDTVSYKHYPAAYLSARAFDKYVFVSSAPEPESGSAYILPSSADTGEFIAAGFEAFYYGYFVVLK